MDDELDYQVAFDRAPVGMLLSRRRMIVDCNEQLADVFGTARGDLVGLSLAELYPSAAEFDRIGRRIARELDVHGRYADERIMKRSPGDPDGELFWCRATGRVLDRDDPHQAGIWVLEDLSALRPVIAGTVGLTTREREVATLLIGGRTSRQIGEQLGLSHRTVEVHRASLMRKYETASTAELVDRLVGAPGR